jgi:ABC-type Fe3+/spermidine/putrescine transport system ATPase subunit
VVRPEKLRIDAVTEEVSQSNGLPRVEGIVESSLYLGTSTQIVVDLGEGVRMTVLVPNASEAERRELPGAGVRVSLSWEPDHMHVVRESPATRESLDTRERGEQGGAQLEATRRGD